MTRKIIISIIMWLIYAASAITMIIVIVSFFKILIWDNLKNLFKKNKSGEKILKDLNKYKTFGDVGK